MDWLRDLEGKLKKKGRHKSYGLEIDALHAYTLHYQHPQTLLVHIPYTTQHLCCGPSFRDRPIDGHDASDSTSNAVKPELASNYKRPDVSSSSTMPITR